MDGAECTRMVLTGAPKGSSADPGSAPERPEGQGIGGSRQARQRAGLTQTEFAKAVGVSASTVGRWERHGVKPRSSEVRAKVTEVLGCDPWAGDGQEDQL